MVRLALRHRLNIAGTVLSATAVAVLWGGNIGAVFPFMKVVFEEKSLQQWVGDEIVKAHHKAAELSDSLAKQQKELAVAPPERRPKLESKLVTTRSRLAAEQRAEEAYGWLKPYLDRYLPEDPFLTVALIAAALFLGTLLKDVFAIINSVLAARLAQLAAFDLRKRFYRRTLRLDLATFNDEGTSDLMSRFTNDMQNVASGVESLFGRLICEPLKMVACLALAAWISWRLLLLSLVIAPLAGLAIRWLAKTLKRASRRAMEEMAQLYNTLEETFRGIKIIKAFTNEPQQRRFFHDRSKAYYKKAMKIARYDSLSHPLTETLGILTLCLALLAGAWLVLRGATSILGIPMAERAIDRDWLLVFYGALAGVADPMRKFSEIFSRLQVRHGGQRPHLPAAGPRAGGLQPRRAGAVPASPPRAGFRPRRFRLPARPAGAGRHPPAHPLRRDDRHRRSQRLRQEHAGQSGAALRRSYQRHHPAGRRAPGQHAIARPPRPDRHRHPGNRALRRYGVQQHSLRASAGDDGRSDRGRQAGPRPPLHRARIARGLPDRGRHAGRAPLRRTAAADRLGPRDPARPRHLDPR